MIRSSALVVILIAVLTFSLITPATKSLGQTQQPARPGKAGIPVPLEELLSSGGRAALYGKLSDAGGAIGGAYQGIGPFGAAPGAAGNRFVNDPCLDPAPPNRARTVQSETEIAVLNDMRGSHGKLMIVGYNDSFGFANNREGLSGVAYSINGGSTWFDQAGVPPRIPSGAPVGTPGSDGTFGDPVVVVHHGTGQFFYSYIYQTEDGVFTLGVSRGRFELAPSQAPVESRSSIRCAGNAAAFGQPDPPGLQLRPIWDLPTVAVREEFLRPDDPATPQDESDFLDKEWIYVDQNTGTLYVTYTRFTAAGETPIELVRCIRCAFKDEPLEADDWTEPTVIVPNEALDFNQATQPVTTPSGRVIVTWIARTFAGAGGAESENRIEIAVSDDDGETFGPEQTVAVVNPQREPPGYNRVRRTILNAPYIVVDKGVDDGVITATETSRPGFGNVYITYFSGKTPLPILPTTRAAADIFVSTSTNGGASFLSRVKVNDDNATTGTVHIFPAIQVNKDGKLFVQWIDRRNDPTANIMNETWADVSKNRGLSFGEDEIQSSLATSWFTRANARPNMGDYNSAELIDFDRFVITWADGRFPGNVNATCARGSNNPCPINTPEPTATPDTIFQKVNF